LGGERRRIAVPNATSARSVREALMPAQDLRSLPNAEKDLKQRTSAIADA